MPDLSAQLLDWYDRHHRTMPWRVPPDQRKAGVAGHGIALTLLWRELVERRGWPVIDVTRRSIEETAAAILAMLHDRDVTTAG